MQFPIWLKPLALGAAGGAAGVAIIGFSWGGWMTATASERMANDMAREQLVAAMTPVCVAQANRDPNQEAKMAKIQDTSSYKRDDAVMDAGWATMPGTTEANQAIARACLKALQSGL